MNHPAPASHAEHRAFAAAESAPAWLPLSDAQRMVWMDLKLGAAPCAYQLALRSRIEGPVELSTLRQAGRMLAARHDALRLRVDAEQPRQWLAPESAMPLLVHDLRHEGGEAALATEVAQVLASVLPLGDHPLAQVDLFQLDGTRWELVWRVHHLIADLASLTLLVQQFVAIYNALLDEVPGDLPSGSSFVGTLAAEQAYAASPAAAADLAHWRRRYDEVPLPVFERGTAPAGASLPVRWVIEGVAYTAWRTACTASGVSEQRALVGLLALAVGTRHDRCDFTIGVALHRREARTRHLIGMLAGILPVRCRWRRGDSVRQAVRTISDAMEADYRHQRTPVAEISRALHLVGQGPGRLFDISLSYVPADEHGATQRLGAAAVLNRPLDTLPLVPLPLLVVDRPLAKRLEFELTADAGFVDGVAAASLVAGLQRVLEMFCRRPGLPVVELEPAPAEEQRVLLHHFNPPPQSYPYPHDSTLHELFGAQVRAKPEALAVVDGQTRLSYAELDARSDLLAGRIRAALAGAGPEPVVGVALPRSADTVVALLAILKAQAVYLPLDIAYPEARLQYMLDDARASLLIDAPDDLTATLTAPRLSAEAGGAGEAGEAGETGEAAVVAPRPVETSPQRARRLAYVIYTSGSSGQPKPVGMSHGAAVNLAHARQGHDPLGCGDRVLAAISVGFDVSIGQLLLPLLSGAAIVIAPPLRTLQAQAFWALLQTHGVTHINSVPSFFEAVSEALPPEGYRGLKRLMLGGEALTGALARKLQQRLPGTQIVNMYGPTETCIDATAYVVPAEGELPAALPIGRPLGNYRAYVLDSVGRLVPTGVAGELCIAGAGLARGYLGRPGETAQKFTADPYAEAGSRLYRTGDLARWTVDGQGQGQIEFLGRNDQQVKIRGHRVETGEIQAVLLEHPGVQQAAVVARKDAAGQLRLIGYLVGATTGQATTGQAPAVDVLKPWLARRLPEHMVPSALVWLPALPLTTNGKLDLRALPDVDMAQARIAQFEPPQGEPETLLAGIWAELLGRERVGREDQFFELGGHSLLAITLVDRLRQAGWRLDVPAVFSQPRLLDMALACTTLIEGTSVPPVPPRGIPEGARRITPDMLPMVALSQAHIDAIVEQLPGGAAQVQDIYPTVALQSGMLFHHLKQRQGDIYLTPFITGHASRARLDAFIAVLRSVIARHDALRTSIAWEGLPGPVQVVWRDAALALEELAPDPSQGALAQLQARVDPAAHRIDLRRAPLMRAVAVQDATEGRWLLALCLHHLVLDHASIDIVMQEVMALQQGRPLPPAVPFRDIVWQAAHGPSDAAHEAYFRSQLGDVTTPTAPYGLHELLDQADGIREATLSLPADLAAAVRTQARAAGASVASLIHLAWALVLARTSERAPGDESVVFGTVLFGRMSAATGAQQAMGMLINTLPLRLHLGGAPVLQALRAAHAGLTGLMRHEHAPLHLAQRCSGVAAPTPLFTALLNLRHNAPVGRSGLELDLLHAEERTGFPLTLNVDDDGQGLRLTAQGVAPAEPARVARLMQEALSDVARALAEAPETPCSALDLIDAHERHTVLHGFNATQADYPRGLCLHELFQQQVLRTPQAPALVCEAVTLSYAELNARANRLAHHLVALGVGPDRLVALLLDRSVEMVVALLATHKAGGAYVPLDPEHPAQRLAVVLGDARPALLLTQAHLLASAQAAVAASGPNPPVLVLDAPRPTWSDCSPLDPLPATAGLHSRHLAYVIYTSGSTGQPKGVMVEHEAVVNRLQWMQQAYALQPGERVLQKTPYGFDVSVWEFFWTLQTGACLVLARPGGHKDPRYLCELIVQQRIGTLHFVPSMLQAFLQHPQAKACRGLRRIVCSGEALSLVLAQRCADTLPQAALYNLYGPTEAAVDVSEQTCEPGLRTASGGVPIGRPIANTRLYVLDPALRPVPVGVSGELCIGGIQLARGYLNQEALTAQRFVADPYAAEAGEPWQRMYLTGDLARWLPDGRIEYLGRNDHQVKIRGMRIELGEIEAALLGCPGIHEAVVVAREDANPAIGKRLVAYYTLAGGQAAPPADSLKARLARMLPEHMLPWALVALPQMPLSSNGKLDRKALPEPEATAGALREFDPPQGLAEQALAAIWSELLQQPRIGRQDNFFDLGGHSLLAIGMVERMRLAGLHVDVPTLFNQPTLQGLAAAARDVLPPTIVSAPPVGIPDRAVQITPAMLPMVELTQAQIDSVVAAIPGGAAQVQDIYPLAALQQGMLFHHLQQPRGDVFITPMVLGFADRMALDGFVQALQRVIARHDILRTSVAWENLPEPVQVVWREAALQLEEAQAAPGDDALPALRDRVDPRRHRLDLRRAPLLRAVAMPDASEQRWLLALCVHHLALDHTSMDIVLQEVADLRQGRALPPPLPFRDLLWQARQGVGIEAHETFFREMLGDVDAPTTPFGLSEVQGDAQGVAEARLALPATLAIAVREQARAHGTGPATLMHLAWALVLARTSADRDERDDVVFGTVLFGRMNAGAGADRALGMLINTLPLRVRVGAQAVGAALQATQQGLVQLMRHEHAPLSMAQRCSGVAAPTPLFTALFNYRHAYAAPPVPGIELLWGEERTGYPLALAVDDDGTGFGLVVQSVTPVDPERVARLMTQAVAQIVAALRDAPQTPCAALELVDDEERALLLHHFNPPPQSYPYPHDSTLHELFGAQVRAKPEALAVVDGQTRLSYAELDARSDLLAGRIRAALAGAGPEPVVGVALPRSADTVVALLAILKAQAVYLPLDIAYPEARLQYMLDDARASLLIDAPDDLTATLTAPRLSAEAGGAGEAGEAGETGEAAVVAPRPVETSPQRARRLAYVIYTSGSSGQPKPVGMSHGAAVNLAHARQGHDPLGCGDRVLAAISVGFDVSIGQLLLPLLSGAAIVIAPPLRTLQAQAFWALLQTHGVTHINSVPSFFEAVSEALPPEGYRGLKRLMLGGEALTGALARKLQQRLPGTQIVNMYGPTETCIDATAYVVPAEGELPAALPIGRPLGNYRAYVLDSVGRLVPTGVAGELCIAGAGLARGYLGRPGETAQKFTADPYAEAGSRLYRTGDLARWTVDGQGQGQIEFLGRNDQQVKIRGHRVETGEIQAVLLEHPGVQQAAVVARKDAAGQLRLIGYLVGATTGEATTGQAPAVDVLKPWLARRLPEHMVPSALVWLPALPLTTNGKLDLRALPDVDIGAPGAAVYVAARDALEQHLQTAWQRVLGREAIGVHDDFFALGGHSLLALRVVSASQAALRTAQLDDQAERLTLRALFAAPTIEALAQALRQPAAVDVQAAEGLLLPLRATGSRTPLFCVHPQAGMAWCYAELARHVDAEVPVWGLQAQGLHRGELPLDSVPEMAATYVRALRGVQPRGPYQLLGYSAGGLIAHAMAVLLREAGEAVALLALLDSPLPDGRDTRAAQASEVLRDSRTLLGLAADEPTPANAAALCLAMQQRGLFDLGITESDAERMIETARLCLHAARRHTAAPSAQPPAQRVLQVHVKRRDPPSPEWQPWLGTALVHTHVLDCDHAQLVDAERSAAVAAWLNPGLR